jgi:VWFA-related protein
MVAVLAAGLFGQQSTQQGVPNAPAPQPVPQLKGTTPGEGTLAAPSADQLPKVTPANAPPSAAGAAGTQTGAATPSDAGQPLAADQQQQSPPEIGKPGDDEKQIYTLPRVHVNFVIVPVQVRDKQNQLVPGLTWRDFQVFENNTRERLVFFSSDAIPVSAAIVVDQTLTSDVMKRVNEALPAIIGAFSKYDEVSVFTYNNGVQQQTDYTAAQGDRLPAILMQSRAPGRDMGVPVISGPMAEGPTINGRSFDPNLAGLRNGGGVPITPRENHTLNDAIFAAAQTLAPRDKERRKIIYVISDGREQGSKLSQHEVEKFLLTNNIAVYGTLVGESALWGMGYLDKIHLPLQPRANVLPKYALDTGGALDSELTSNGIQNSFARVVESARAEYTLGYDSQIPVTDPSFRKIDVRVEKPGLTVVAKDGYYPTPVRQQ